MKITLIGKAKTIMSNPDSKFNHFSWPTAKRLQNGKIAVAASGFRRRHVCPFGKTVISFSENEGETYTLPTPVIDTVLDDRDGGLCTYGESGLIVTSFNNRADFQREQNIRYTENGWDTQPEPMKSLIDKYLDTITQEEEEKYVGSTFRMSDDCGVTFGEIKKSPVTSPHGPIELHDGTILWVGSLYGSDDPLTKIQAHKINKDGTTELVGIVPPIYDNGKLIEDPAEPYAIQLSNGRIICHTRVTSIFTTFQSVSDDNGKTWSEPIKIFEDFGGAPSHIIEHSSGVLICSVSVRHAPCGIRIYFSKDNGETWTDGQFIYDYMKDGDFGYPSTVELKDGSLLTVFYVRDHPVNVPCVIRQQKWSFED